MISPIKVIKNLFLKNIKKLSFCLGALTVAVISASYIAPITERLDEVKAQPASYASDHYDEGEGDPAFDEQDFVSITGDEASSYVSYDSKVEVFDKNDWRLLLINKQHPIPEGYTFEFGKIKGSMKCDARIIADLMLMLKAAADDGMELVVRSPYRDSDRQEYLFKRKTDAYMKDGLSFMDAYKEASQIVTVPGSSEHQVGLALDISTEAYPFLNEGFGDTEEGKWLAAHAHEYGFTLRYPKGKEYITSIEFEPWHFRYVGRDAATLMYNEGICLEEFVERL